MRLVLAVLVALPLVASCAAQPATTDAKPALTERQRDSLIARSTLLPGATVVDRAMKVSDAAAKDAATKDQQVAEEGSNEGARRAGRSDRLRGMPPAIPRTFERYVAIGDSSTEGLDDPRRPRRLPRLVAASRRADRARSRARCSTRTSRSAGARPREIREQQLAPALAMRPDLATVFSGTNDVLRRRFDPAAVGRDMEAMQRAFVEQGATVLTFTLPDLTPLMPVARLIAPRIAALNEALRGAASRSGAILLDFAALPGGLGRASVERRSYPRERRRPRAHRRRARARARAPGTDDAWMRPLPETLDRSPGKLIAAELGWTRRHLLPWTWQGVRARFLPREERRPKRPALEPVRIEA